MTDRGQNEHGRAPAFSVLGPLEVTSPAGPVTIAGARRRSLLIRLLLSAGTVVSVDQLVEDLWRDDPPRTAVKALQMQIGHLRRSLGAGGVVVTRNSGYSVEIAPDQLDVHRAERLAAHRRVALAAGDAPGARRVLAEALALWRGRSLLDVEGEPFAQAEVSRLDDLRLGVIEDWAEACLVLEAHAEVIGALERSLDGNAWRERAWGQLMLAYAREDRQADALRAYQRARAHLGEIGLEPGARLRSLEHSILDGSVHRTSHQAGDPAVRGSSGGMVAPTGLLPDSVDPLTVGGDAFVGRGAELAVIEQRWREARDGRRRILLVEGEPGIGKTRLAAQAALRVTAAGGLVVRGRCDEDTCNPYQPFTELFDRLTAHLGDERLRAVIGDHGPALAPIVPGLARLTAALVTPVSPAAGIDRVALFHAVTDVLLRLADLAPVLFVIDDLHWASESTVSLLRHWLDRTADAPVALLATYRPHEVAANPRVQALVGALAGHAEVATLSLDELTFDEVVELAADDGTRCPADERHRLGALIHARAGGNPLLATQLLRHCRDGGSLPVAAGTTGGAPRALATAADDIPRSVLHVVRHRLARLDETVTSALKTAAVVGIEFDLEVLERVLDATTSVGSIPDALLALETAVDARLLDEQPGGGGFRFVHALVREAVYAGVSQSRRARLHAAVGDALAALGRPAPAVAFHYHLAAPEDGCERAVRWLEQAAQHHMYSYSWEEARDAFSRALMLVDRSAPIDLARRGRLRGGLAWLAEAMGDPASCHAYELDAMVDVRSSRDVRALARAAIWRSGTAQVGRRDDLAVELRAEALARLGDDHAPLRAILHACEAFHQAVIDGRGYGADDRARAAVAEARGVENVHVLRSTLTTRLCVLQGSPKLAEQWALVDEIQVLAALDQPAHEPQEFEIWACLPPIECLDLVLRLQTGDRLGFEAKTDEVGRHLSCSPLWNLRPLVDMWQALLALLDGRLADARHFTDRMLGAGLRTQNLVTSWALLHFQLARDEGRLDEVAPQFAQAAGWYTDLPIAHAVVAAAHLGTGRSDRAVAALDALADHDLPSLAASLGGSFVLATLADVACRTGDRNRAAAVYAELLPYSGQMLVVAWGVFVVGAADRYLGDIAAVLGRHDDADEYFRRALHLEEAFPAPALAAWTRLRWGRALLARDDDVAHRRGAGLLAEAAGSANALGLGGIIDQIHPLHATRERTGAPGRHLPEGRSPDTSLRRPLSGAPARADKRIGPFTPAG